MSLSQEWEKAIESMTPNRASTKDKLIDIHENKKKSFSRARSSRTKRSSTSVLRDIKKSVNNNTYVWYIAVFCAFYVLGWFVIFATMDSAESASRHRGASLLHPNGEVTHYLPRQIQAQIDKLANLEAMHEWKDHIMNFVSNANSDHNNNNNIILQRINAHSKANKDAKHVAINILITKDPGIAGGFLDSAGALVMSVVEAQSVHNIRLIALVHQDVKYCLPILEAMGYEIRAYDTPFQIEDVRNKKIGEEMRTDGCCGILETLKLWAWTWTEFDVVLSVDADVHFHRNFDELFALNTTLGWTHGATADIGQELMNGGFLVVRPNVKHFEDMVEVMKEGDFSGRGWKGSGVGWVYGGRTIQGIVPYYYLKVAVGDETEFDRCKYNNMVEIEKCRTWQFSQVTSNHFTWCQKPWYCVTSQGQPLCDAFRESWWKHMNEFETEILGFKEARSECKRKPYPFLKYYESPYMLQYFKEHGYATTEPEIPDEFFQQNKHI